MKRKRRGVTTATRIRAAGVAAIVLGFGGAAGAGEPPADGNRNEPEGGAEHDAAESERDPAYVLRDTMRLIDGKKKRLSDYEGKVVMIVNTASECGFTPQYEGLQALYETYKDKGFVVLGFPANQFGGQEPGTNEQIAEFCTERFNVTFPMFEKIVVKGEQTHPLYERLADQPEPIGGPPKWNFTKFLVDRRGHVVARFGPRDEPRAEKVIERIEALLAEEPGSGDGASEPAARN